MRVFRVATWMAGGALLVAGCSGPQQTAGSAAPHGRYVGIGAYSVGELWSRMAVAEPSKVPAAATPADDEHVIVVVDSQTGEVRECGDYSGLCVSLNPWTKAVATGQTGPVTLTKHRAELDAEQKGQPAPAR